MAEHTGKSLDTQNTGNGKDKGNRTIMFLLVIILIGGILRFAKLDYQSLWNDELSSVVRTDFNSLGEVIESSKSDVHPPLYYCLLYLWRKNIGSSPFSVRALSALFGVLAIAAIFFLGRTLYTAREALISALILAISQFGIYYSQEVRSYSLLLLLSICSYLFFLKIQPQSTASRSQSGLVLSYILYILSTTMLIYTHYFGILVLFSQFVFILMALAYGGRRGEKGYLKILASQLGIGILYLPQISVIRAKMQLAETWIPRPRVDFFIQYFHEYWGRSETFFLLASLCLFCFWYFRKNEGENDTQPGFNRSALVLVWVIVPLVTAYARSILSTPVLTDRNTIIILPPLILMMARGITSIKNKDLSAALLAAVVIAGCSSLLLTNEYYYRITKDQFREVADVVLENKEISDQSLIIASAWNAGYFDYYFQQAASPFRVSHIYENAEDIPAFEALAQGSGKRFLWYLIGHKYPSQEFLQHLEKNYKLLGTRQFKKCSFFLFALEKRP
ncbi:MAG: glycosyltransferase family 39 protein [bacterium]